MKEARVILCLLACPLVSADRSAPAGATEAPCDGCGKPIWLPPEPARLAAKCQCHQCTILTVNRVVAKYAATVLPKTPDIPLGKQMKGPTIQAG